MKQQAILGLSIFAFCLPTCNQQSTQPGTMNPPPSTLSCKTGDPVALASSLNSAGNSVDRLVSADFDGDGRADLLLITSGSPKNMWSIWLSQKTGEFNKLAPIIDGVTEAAIGDINKDGKLDVVIGHAQDIQIYAGDGKGGFQAKESYAVGVDPVRIASIAIGDINADGLLDIVTSNVNQITNDPKNSVSILLGKSVGTFQNAKNYPLGAAASLFIEDYDQNGRQDLLVASPLFDQTISLYLSFSGQNIDEMVGSPNQRIVATHVATQQILFEDVNQDGKRDLVYGDYHDGFLKIQFGDGKGNFQPLQSLPAGQALSGIAFQDVNADKIPDVIVADFGKSELYVFLGQSDGTLVCPQSHATLLEPYNLVEGDFDGDGRPEIVVSSDSKGADLQIFSSHS